MKLRLPPSLAFGVIGGTGGGTCIVRLGGRRVGRVAGGHMVLGDVVG